MVAKGRGYRIVPGNPGNTQVGQYMTISWPMHTRSRGRGISVCRGTVFVRGTRCGVTGRYFPRCTCLTKSRMRSLTGLPLSNARDTFSLTTGFFPEVAASVSQVFAIVSGSVMPVR